MNNITALHPIRRPSTEQLVTLMNDRWTDTFGNVGSAALRASWRQAFETFERKIGEHGTAHAPDWYVLSPATGTGKSESLKVYAAATAHDSPGVMIVVRLIAQADEFVRDINELAGETVAVARHSSVKPGVDTLKDFPVLVITHAAFTGRVRNDHDLWGKYIAFKSTKRKLVVVDEALDILQVSRVQAADVDRAIGAVPYQAWDRWPDAKGAMMTMLGILREIEAKAIRSDVKSPRAALLVGQKSALGRPTSFEDQRDALLQLAELADWMNSDEHQYVLGRRGSWQDAERAQKDAYGRIFQSIIAIYSNFIVYSKEGSRHTLSTARSMLPDEGQGCVVLDATSSTNAVYECLASAELRVFKVAPVRSREYSKVALKTSMGHAVGRSSLVEPEKKTGIVPITVEAPKLLESLTKEYHARAGTSCPMEKVLIVCHAAGEQHLAGFDVPFHYETAHYGALDGRNDWRDFDSVVIFGLDYRNPNDATVSFIALQGDDRLDLFGESSDRAFGGHDDIITAMNQGWIVSSLIQAVNRIRTRTVVDHDGGCPPSYVYLTLPEGKLGKAVYRTLQEQMPGIVAEVWNTTVKKAAARSEYVPALEALIRAMKAGDVITAPEARRRLGASDRVWQANLAKRLKDETSVLGQAMLGGGVVYETVRAGKSTISRLRAV